MTLRVLYCVDSFGLGGKERQAVELVKGLNRREDVELLVVCMDRGEFYEPDVEALEVPVRYVTRRFRWDPSLFGAIHRIVEDFRPAVIHSNGMVGSFYLLPIAKWHRIPLVNGSIRNAFTRRHLRWRLERLLLSWSDFRVANSAAGLRSRSLPTSSGRNFVVHNGFDFARVRGHSAAPDPGSTPVVGMVAEFNPYKDYATFISAALRLLAAGQSANFVAIGDGQKLAATKCLVPATCGAITFLGRRKDVEHIISGFSIGVLATFTEGISNSIMEYMALGKPVVATDAGGSRELVLDGHTGFLVPPRDPAALADRIAYLLERPDLARTMGAAGQRRIEEHFSLEMMTEETVGLYKQAIRLSSGAPNAGTISPRAL